MVTTLMIFQKLIPTGQTRIFKTVTATYSQTTANITLNHVESIDVTFTSLETFEGLSADSFTIPVLGECTLYWNITGVKQE